MVSNFSAGQSLAVTNQTWTAQLQKLTFLIPCVLHQFPSAKNLHWTNFIKRGEIEIKCSIHVKLLPTHRTMTCIFSASTVCPFMPLNLLYSSFDEWLRVDIDKWMKNWRFWEGVSSSSIITSKTISFCEYCHHSASLCSICVFTSHCSILAHVYFWHLKGILFSILSYMVKF